ncbi:hypothetical protein [uncultured Rubinisphaera sp.]|uniref:hypothetical protein n=1 Tax=uncultured Rubinisphaera sp. TaxID=1678686 RepID=UPI0030D793A4
MAKFFHPLFVMIASATDRELVKYVEYLKAENQILRARIPGQIHTTANERQKLIKLCKGIGRAIEELITIVTPTTFFRWLRDEKGSKSKIKNPKGGQRKPYLLKDFVIESAKTIGFDYSEHS